MVVPPVQPLSPRQVEALRYRVPTLRDATLVSVLAYGGLRLLLAIVPTNLPRLDQISIDAPVLLFTLVVSLLGGALFGAIPAIKHAGPQVTAALRSGGRTSSSSRERHRTRNTLVVVQVALALVLLIGS